MPYDWREDFAANTKNYSQGLTALAVSDRARQERLEDLATARQQRLEDIADQQKFQEKSAEAAAKRRIKENREQERMRVISEAIKDGVTGVTEKDTETSIAEKRAKHNADKAERTLRVIEFQRTGLITKQQEAMDKVKEILSEPAIGNPALRREALRAALADPAAQDLPMETRRDLQKVVDSPTADPAAAMAKLAEAMQRKGWGAGKRFEQWSAFSAAYMTGLEKYAVPQQQNSLALAVRNVDELGREAKEFGKLASQALVVQGEHLSASAFKDWMGRLGSEPPKDPTSVIKPTPVKAPVSAPPTPIVPVNPQTITDARPTSQVFEEEGVGGLVDRVAAGARSSDVPMSVKAGMARGVKQPQIPDAEGWNAFWNGAGKPASTNAISDAELMKGMMNVPPRGTPTLLPATTEEQAKIEQFARSLGMDDARMAKARAMINAGDPQAIATANRMLLLMRKASQSPLDSGSAFAGTTAEGRPIIKNPDGSVSTERTMTFGVDGKYVNVPTLWDGKQLAPQDALTRALAEERAGKVRFERFNSEDEAISAAKARSNNLGLLYGGTQ
jgi:hypothetical protein